MPAGRHFRVSAGAAPSPVLGESRTALGLGDGFRHRRGDHRLRAGSGPGRGGRAARQSKRIGLIAGLSTMRTRRFAWWDSWASTWSTRMVIQVFQRDADILDQGPARGLPAGAIPGCRRSVEEVEGRGTGGFRPPSGEDVEPAPRRHGTLLLQGADAGGLSSGQGDGGGRPFRVLTDPEKDQLKQSTAPLIEHIRAA